MTTVPLTALLTVRKAALWYCINEGNLVVPTTAILLYQSNVRMTTVHVAVYLLLQGRHNLLSQRQHYITVPMMVSLLYQWPHDSLYKFQHYLPKTIWQCTNGVIICCTNYITINCTKRQQYYRTNDSITTVPMTIYILFQWLHDLPRQHYYGQ